MGSGQSTNKKKHKDAHRTTEDREVNFEDFLILRAIGKGSFGKVCIVQKKDSKTMYAMKYMSKNQCITKDAFRNVLQEIEILSSLEHPFLVNLWFTFQDEEDMFMVVDLLLGGDLRYHIHQEGNFDEARVCLYLCEVAMALDYLQSKYILHRDIKPDNILLDETGHVHITDFNIATILKDGELATSMSGTKPYMAPEVFDCALDKCPGYTFPADWWSLGVCCYEMLYGTRPYDIHSNTSLEQIHSLFLFMELQFPCPVSEGMEDLIRKLLTVDNFNRINTLEHIKKHSYLAAVDFSAIYEKKVTPTFIPSKDQLNCDPTFELEEMIIESKPLHKKKKRLSKRSSRRDPEGSSFSDEEAGPFRVSLSSIQDQFIVYNREKELEKQMFKQREVEWEAELQKAMS
ncbi:serine/threonine-protein kinase 32B-like [Tachypleus tridentatus]|uniref:serine/threonine-protein kinase 32B-like n=1 Tax=Tachypleus tridentatus TaxID=6853 RepID=UPI003FCF4D33